MWCMDFLSQKSHEVYGEFILLRILMDDFNLNKMNETEDERGNFITYVFRKK